MQCKMSDGKFIGKRNDGRQSTHPLCELSAKTNLQSGKYVFIILAELKSAPPHAGLLTRG